MILLKCVSWNVNGQMQAIFLVGVILSFDYVLESLFHFIKLNIL